MASIINASTSGVGGVITTADNSGDLNIQSGGSTKIAVTSAGAAVTGTLTVNGTAVATAGGAGSFTTVEASSTIKGGSTIAVGGATPAASGAGITFPATQSASTDANTLDDYEEGTWTPSITFATASVGVTYSVRSGTYTKVGNTVFIAGRIGLSSKGSSTGYIQIEGLPFAGQVISGAGAGGGNVMYVGSWTGLTNMFISQYDTVLTVNAITTTGYANLTNTNVTNTSSIYFYCTYQV